MSRSYVNAFGVLVKGRDDGQPLRECHRSNQASFQLDGHTFTVCGCGNVFHDCDPTLKCKARLRLIVRKRPKP